MLLGGRIPQDSRTIAPRGFGFLVPADPHLPRLSIANRMCLYNHSGRCVPKQPCGLQELQLVVWHRQDRMTFVDSSRILGWSGKIEQESRPLQD